MLVGNSAMKKTYRAVMLSGSLVVLGSAVMCSSDNRTVAAPTAPSPTPASPPTTGTTIATDAALFQLVTQAEPFGSYSLFPNAEAINRNASSAHRPADRVRVNARALTALQNGRLSPGTRFPDGSVIFKEILASNGATTTLYSIMYKEADNPLATNGWLWAEFNLNGSVAISINSRGAACTSCHSSGQGSANDFVRTFERQR